MTTSDPTTRSPSRRSTTRSTPCVLGCWGPMLITSSSVSNMGWGVGAVCIAPSGRHQATGTGQRRLLRALWLAAQVAYCLLPIAYCLLPTPCACLLNIRRVVRRPQPEPVERVLHEQLAWPLERVVLALRIA